jgi:hypothetical protein
VHTNPLCWPPALQASSFWGQGRAQLWAGLLLCSLLFLAWDLKLSDWWEDWCLERRKAARLQGRKFTAQENLDDIVTYVMKSVTGNLEQPPQQQQQQQPAAAAADLAGLQQGGGLAQGAPTRGDDAARSRPAQQVQAAEESEEGKR